MRPECYVDDDCSYSDVCNKGSCINACRLSDCGLNTKCETGRHSARCICLSGYTGNPRTACTLCKYSKIFILFYVFFSMLHVIYAWFHILAERPVEPVLSVGCEQDDDCPLYTACRNRQCINPCAEDSPCAPSAICRVINHKPLCTCPDGFIGSPHTDCRPRKLQF